MTLIRSLLAGFTFCLAILRGTGKSAGFTIVFPKRLRARNQTVIRSKGWSGSFSDGSQPAHHEIRAHSSCSRPSWSRLEPKEPFYEHDFDGARWIWTDDLALDNLVLFRFTVEAPPSGAVLPPSWPRGRIDAANRTMMEL